MNNGEKNYSNEIVWCVSNPNLSKIGCFGDTRCYFCVVGTVGVEPDECLITEDKTITWFVIAK